MQTKTTFVREGQVYLLSGGGKIFTDIAARFTKSERDVLDIADSPYTASLVNKIINSGHLAATEFDYFIFGIQGYSRVTEVQLVRKRLASYLIKSGRTELKGKRQFSVVYPFCLNGYEFNVTIKDKLIKLSVQDLMDMLAQVYDQGLEMGIPEEELRYLKPQATEFKAIIGMNAHALLDWFGLRLCQNAQTEIRDLATKMLSACQRVAPDLFAQAGPRCKHYGYCPEDEGQNKFCRMNGIYLPKTEALNKLRGL